MKKVVHNRDTGIFMHTLIHRIFTFLFLYLSEVFFFTSSSCYRYCYESRSKFIDLTNFMKVNKFSIQCNETKF